MSYVRGYYRKTRSGSTWVKGHSRKTSGNGLLVGLVVICVVIYIVYSIVKALFTFIATNYALVLMILSPFLIGFIIYLIFNHGQKKHFKKLCLETDRFIDSFPEKSDEHLSSISSISKKILNKKLVHNQLNFAYQVLISKIVKSGSISSEDEQIIKKTENSFCLDSELIRESKRSGFISVYEQAIEDNYLTDDEENRLFSIYRSLGIDKNEINEQMKFLQQLSTSRKIASNSLKPVDCDIPLGKNESCFYHVKSRQFKRRTEKGQYSLESADFGTLYITDMRVVFIGTTSIEVKEKDIAHFGVKDRKYIELVKVGRVTPYYFLLDEPFTASAIYNKAKSRS